MKIKYLGLTILFLAGCNIFSSDEKVEEEESPLSWSSRKTFPADKVFSVWISKQDEILIGSSGSWLKSSNYGDSFVEYSIPDSVYTWYIKKEGTVYYGFGQLNSRYHVIAGDTTDAVLWFSHNFYKSLDGQNWEKISGPYDMYDFYVQDNLAYISTLEGVVTVDLETKQEYYDKFLQTNSLDIINDIEVNSNKEIFAASHDGIHKSTDEGKTWEKVTEEIHKSVDRVEKLIILNNNDMYAIGTSVLFSGDNGESWEILEFEMENYDGEIQGMFLDDMEIAEDRNMYSINYLGFFMANSTKEDVPFTFYGPQMEDDKFETPPLDYNSIHLFNNGDILISRWNNNVFHIGKRNRNAKYWLN